jgi:hypothetical protein
MSDTFLIFLGVLTLVVVNMAIVTLVVYALRVFLAIVKPAPQAAPDTSEEYTPLNVERGVAADEGIRDSRYVMSEHELVAGLDIDLDYDEFIAAERRREKEKGIRA